MAIETSVQIHGLRQLQDAMRQLPAKVDRQLLNEGLLVGARQVSEDAKRRVPLLRVPDPRRVRGALQKAIQAIRVRPRGYTATVLVRVRQLTKAQIRSFKKRQSRRGARVTGQSNPADPFYWVFVEFGTSKMAARPFLRPAFEARKVEAVNAAVAKFRERIQAEIEKLGRRFA